MNQHRHAQHRHRNPSNQRNQPSAGDAQQQRRAFLWRERVRLEMQVHACIAQHDGLRRAWQLLAKRKAAMQHRQAGLSTQILLSGLAGVRQLPAERLFQYERERLRQEELRLQQAAMQCQRDLTALQAQIEVILVELSFLC